MPHTDQGRNETSGKKVQAIAASDSGRGIPTIVTPPSSSSSDVQQYPTTFTARGPEVPREEMFPFDYSWDHEPAQESDVLNFNGILDMPEDVSQGDALKLIRFFFSSSQGYQKDALLTNRQLFASDMSFASLDSGSSSSMAFANCGNMSALSAGNSSSKNPNSRDSATFEAHKTMPSGRSAATKMLLSFAFTLHERLEGLENGPWQREGTYQSLNSYPIGSVLHLSHEFTVVANALRRIGSGDSPKASSTSLALSNNCQEQCSESPALDGSSSSGSATATTASSTSTSSSYYFNTSDTHILLGCYAALSRIHFIVLEYFQNYVNLQPSGRLRAPSTDGVEFGPTVCLGELPSISPEYSRIHTAICLLLDSLREVEEALGLPPQIRCAGGGGGGGQQQPLAECRSTAEPKTVDDTMRERELANALTRWGLLTNATSIQEEFTALGKKVTDIKDLLREKMDL